MSSTNKKTAPVNNTKPTASTSKQPVAQPAKSVSTPPMHAEKPSVSVVHDAPLTVEQIVAKSKRGEKLNKHEVQALRAVGMKKDGTPLKMHSGARDLIKLTPQKLLGAIEMFGVVALEQSKAARAGDPKALSELQKVVIQTVKITEKANHPLAAEIKRKRIEIFPASRGRGAVGGTRKVEFLVTDSGRGVIDMRGINGKPGDLFKPEVVVLPDGRKAIVCTISTLKADRKDLPVEGADAPAQPVAESKPLPSFASEAA